MLTKSQNTLLEELNRALFALNICLEEENEPYKKVKMDYICEILTECKSTLQSWRD